MEEEVLTIVKNVKSNEVNMKLIKKILNNFEKDGYKAYVVGGFVRDYLLNKKSYDIDICTNKVLDNNTYGSKNFKYKKYNIDITTFRKELEYTKRKPTKLIYVNSLEEDLRRRDFTINAICMDKNMNIIDLFDGVNDLNNKIIKMIGDPKEKLKEDPLRILRAIRFATILDFEIDSNLDKEIIDNILLIKTLSPQRIRTELSKILTDKNYLKGITLLNKYKVFEILEITYKELFYVDNEYGMWAQFETPINYGFTKSELVNIINIRQIISNGIIDNHILYKYNLDEILVVIKIFNINQKLIKNMYKNLPLKTEKELKITSDEIISLLNISNKEISNIKTKLINEILNGNLKNNKQELKEYLKRNEM